jgi:hypothetical protein
MRRKHQMVTLAAPGHMIAKSPPVGGFALFPMDRYIFVKSGHSLSPFGNAFYASLRLNPKENQRNRGKKLAGSIGDIVTKACCARDSFQFL